MKTPSLELFQLIKSMTPAEKRIFTTINSEKSTNKGYVLLFNAISKQNEYDEIKLINLINKKVKTTHFKELKSYLLESVLKFMETHCSSYSDKLLFQHYVLRIEVLFTRKLYEIAAKEVNKAEKLANSTNDLTLQFIVLAWKRRLYFKNSIAKPTTKYTHDVYNKEVENLKQQQNLVQLNHLNIQISHFLVTESENISDTTIKIINSLLNHPLLINESNLASTSEKLLHYRINGDIQFLLKNWESHYNYFTKGLTIIKQNNFPFSEQLFFSSRLSISLQKLNKVDEMKVVKNEISKKFNSLHEKTKLLALTITYIPFINNYIDFLLLKNVDEALKTSTESEMLIEKFASIQSKLVFYANTSIAYFLKNDYRKALFYVNKIVAYEKSTAREDIVQLAMLLSLLLHYELKNIELLNYLSKFYYTYFDKSKQKNFIAYLILEFFDKKIQKIDTKKQLRLELTTLKEMILSYENDAMLKMFPFIAWLTSKIENRPFAEVVKERVSY